MNRLCRPTNALYSLFGVFLIASCGQNENLTIPQESPREGTQSEGETSVGLTNGDVYFSDVVRNPWFYSNSDGSPAAGSSRPKNFDKTFASLVTIEDLDTKQTCTGTRIAEKEPNGTWSIWILTATCSAPQMNRTPSFQI